MRKSEPPPELPAPLPPPELEPEPARVADPAPVPETGGGRFLVMSGIQLERRNLEVHCRVELKHGSRSFAGEAREMDSVTGRARAASRATLAAAEQTTPDVQLGLEGISVVELFSRRYVAVSIEAAQGRDFVLLAGMVTLDAHRAIEDAAVLATLRAIDRWLAH